MRILVTGATGFVGSIISERLMAHGHTVYGLTRKDKFYRDVGIKEVQGDLMDYATLYNALVESEPDIVVHLAALTPVRFSFRDPAQYMRTNYEGTVNLMKAILAARPNIQQVVVASTAETYKTKHGLITEEDPLYGTTPYGFSKVAMDFYVQMCGEAFNLPYTIMRATNTFGRHFDLPDEARGYLVEKAIIEMLTKDRCVFDGDPFPRRCWIHAGDHVDGYLQVIDRSDAIGHIFNISSGFPLSVGDVVICIKNMIGFKGEIVWDNNPRPTDPMDLCLSGVKMENLIGWSPGINVFNALNRTIDYWREKLGVER